MKRCRNVQIVCRSYVQWYTSLARQLKTRDLLFNTTATWWIGFNNFWQQWNNSRLLMNVNICMPFCLVRGLSERFFDLYCWIHWLNDHVRLHDFHQWKWRTVEIRVGCVQEGNTISSSTRYWLLLLYPEVKQMKQCSTHLLLFWDCMFQSLIWKVVFS